MWAALALLVITGVILLPNVVNLSESLRDWPSVVFLKLSLVLLLIVVSLAHDQVIGRKVRTLKQQPMAQLTILEKFLLHLSPLIGRLTMILGLAILLVATLMVRT